MKKILTLASIIFCAFAAFAQSQFYNIAVGVNAGVTTAYTGFSYEGGIVDASKSLGLNKSKAFGGSLDYYFTPFVNAGIEYNMVQLKDGPDAHNKQFVSDFSSIELRAGVSLGQFVDYTYNDILYLLRGLNVSLGYGIISGKNNVLPYDPALDYRKDTSLPEDQRVNKNPSNARKHQDDIGKSEFKNVSALPITIGYNFIFYNQYDEQKVLLGIHLKSVLTNSDDLDGFNDNPAFYKANKSKDLYSVIGFSLKYMFGPRSLYFK